MFVWTTFGATPRHLTEVTVVKMSNATNRTNVARITVYSHGQLNKMQQNPDSTHFQEIQTSVTIRTLQLHNVASFCNTTKHICIWQDKK